MSRSCASSNRAARVWVLRFEGNCDHTSGVAGVYRSEAAALAARRELVAEAKAEGGLVYARYGDAELPAGLEADWTIDYVIEACAVEPGPGRRRSGGALTNKQLEALGAVRAFLLERADVARDLAGVDFDDYDDTEGAFNRGLDSQAFELGLEARRLLGRMNRCRLPRPEPTDKVGS